MRVVIIEDEQLAADRLRIMLRNYDAGIECLAHLFTIEESVNWLQNNPHPDLLFVDIQLADGFSFEIFSRVFCRRPIVFTTAYNQFALDAFTLHSIAYLLKPFTAEQLAAAISKYQALCQPVTPAKAAQLMEAIQTPAYIKRFLTKSGNRIFFVETKDISYFCADGKMVYLIDREGNKLPLDYSLEKLEKMLDPQEFFRLNRSHLIHHSSIQYLKPFVNSRYKVLLKCGNKNEEVVMSRERMADFKEWATA